MSTERQAQEAWKTLEQGANLEALRFLARAGRLGTRIFTLWGDITGVYAVTRRPMAKPGELADAITGERRHGSKKLHRYRYTVPIMDGVAVVFEYTRPGMYSRDTTDVWVGGREGFRTIEILQSTTVGGRFLLWANGDYFRTRKGVVRLRMAGLAVAGASWVDRSKRGLVVGVRPELEKWCFGDERRALGLDGAGFPTF